MADDFKKGIEGLERGPEASDRAAPAAPTATTETHPSVTALRGQFGDKVGTHVVMSGDEHVVFVDRGSSYEILSWLRSEQQYDLCKDVTAIDYGGNRPLELYYELWSIPNKRQLRVKVVVPVDDLEADSVAAIWRTADWLEREAYDMFGIIFRNHPDMRRILMPENYAEGYPLRKDFPLRGRFSRAEQTRRALSMDVEDHYTKEEMDVGGVSASSDAHHVDVAEDGVEHHSDPALGNIPSSDRTPMQGGEASQGVNN